ncbi:MAG: sialidase family protein [Thermoplasmatota archaeon]
MRARAMLAMVSVFAAGCVAPAALGIHASAAAARTRTFSCQGACLHIAMLSGAEPSIAVDPTNPQHVIVAAMQNVPPVYSPWIGFATTFDGGTTWTEGQPTGEPTNPTGPLASYNFAADAMVAFTKDGAPVIAALVAHQAPPFACSPLGFPCAGSPAAAFIFDLAVWVSNDGGKTFPQGSVIAHSQGPDAFFPGGRVDLGNLDRDVLVRDARTGELYILFTQRGAPTAPAGIADGYMEPFVARSLDGGRSWSTPIAVAHVPGYGVAIDALNGSVLVAFQDSTGSDTMWAITRSRDGGTTWGPPVVLGPRGASYTMGLSWFVKSGRQGALAIHMDGSSPQNITLNVSTDGGTTWNGGVTVFTSNASAHRLTTSSFDTWTGTGAVAALQPDGSQLAVAVAPLDGSIVGRPYNIPNSSFAPAEGYDYFGLASAGNLTYAAFPHGNYQIAVAALRVDES